MISVLSILNVYLVILVIITLTNKTIFCASSNISDEQLQYNLNVIPNNSVKAIKAAEFAVNELSKLSDSGIYTTLKLVKILYAAEYDGIFHYNILLRLELESLYYRSGKPIEEFKMIVMDHKEDHVKALAIDEFPEMDEDSIEEFTIRKIELKRKQREESFRRLELDEIMNSNQYQFVVNNNIHSEPSNDYTVQDLLTMVDTKDMLEKRIQDSKQGIQQRLQSIQLVEEQELIQFSLKELYDIVTEKNKDATDYQRYRARTLLDVAMNSIT